MNTCTLIGWLCVIVVYTSGCANQSSFPPDYPPVLVDAQEHAYATIGDTSLSLWVYSPLTSMHASQPSPTVLFFFGGGWSNGTPAQFERQAQALSKLGMTSILVDYRVQSRHNSTIAESVSDAEQAMVWVRAQADQLGIDPQRVAAAGGSAGGHLAASTVTLSARKDAQADALVLFNPALILAPTGDPKLQAFNERIMQRAGPNAEAISPYHHVETGHPQTLILHGEDDRLVPIVTAEMYCQKVNLRGGACELRRYPLADHGFFNKTPYFEETLQEMINFFATIDWL